MKTIIFFIPILLLTASSACLSHKKGQKTLSLSATSNRETSTEINQWLSQLQKSDSNTIVWRFHTDAPFVYHPDTGLHAQEGDLWFAMQSARWRYMINNSRDSIVYFADQQHLQRDQTTVSERRPGVQKIGWWIAGILLTTIAGYIIWKSPHER